MKLTLLKTPRKIVTSQLRRGDLFLERCNDGGEATMLCVKSPTKRLKYNYEAVSMHNFVRYDNGYADYVTLVGRIK